MITIDDEGKYNDGGDGGNGDRDVCYILFSNSGVQDVLKKPLSFCVTNTSIGVNVIISFPGPVLREQ